MTLSLIYNIMLSFILPATVVTTVMLSPSDEAFVCQGGQLIFICSTNRSFLEWNVTVSVSDSKTRLISSSTDVVAPLILRENLFNISVNSNGSLTLSSALMVATITVDLNGTMIRCTDVGSSQSETSTSMTVIHVIGAGSAYPNPPEVKITEFFGVDNVSVVLNLTYDQENDVAYDVTVVPRTTVNSMTLYKIAIIQLAALYNTVYNVTIITSLCGLNNATTVVHLYYVNCGSLSQMITETESISIMGYHNPAMLGANATFSCSLDKELIGPNLTTCMENGKWEPDPRNVECKAYCDPFLLSPNFYLLPYSTTTEGSIVIIACQNDSDQFKITENTKLTAITCNEQGNWTPNPASDICLPKSVDTIIANSDIVIISVASSIAVVILSSMLFFILGYFCGRFNKVVQSSQHAQRSTHSNVIYEDIVPESTNSQEQDLELKDNLAYGQI